MFYTRSSLSNLPSKNIASCESVKLMMNTTVRASVDSDLKQEAEAIKKLGLNTYQAILIFLHCSVI